MNIFNNHIRLYITAGVLFALLTYFTVVMPAFQNQYTNMPLPGTKPLSGDAKAGKLIARPHALVSTALFITDFFIILSSP